MANFYEFMEKRWKAIIYVSLFVFILTGIRLLWIAAYKIPDHPQASRGTLDLRGWNFAENEVVTLSGQWEFYPNRFLTPGLDQANSSGTNRSFLQVPGKWEPSSFPADEAVAHRYGTYRLQILIDDNARIPYEMQLPLVQGASRVFINGRLVKESGHPAETDAQTVLNKLPYSVEFTPDSNRIELMLHVANNESYTTGGILKSILLGTQKAMSQRILTSQFMQLMVCVIVLIHAAYGAILYFIGVRQRALLTFSALAICTVISVLVVDDMLLFKIIPYHFEWGVRLGLLSYTCVFALLFAFATQLLQINSKIKQSYRWYYYLVSVHVLLIIVPPSLNYSLVKTLLSFVALPPAILLPLVIYRIVRKENKDAIFLLLGVISIALNIIWASIKGRLLIDLTFYPFDFIAAFLAFATYWFVRYVRISVQTEQLAAKLQKEDKNKDEFLANTSHELRNPLHGMINIAKTVLDMEQARMDTESKKRMELLITVGRRMSFLLSDLLDATRLKEGRVRLEPRNVRVQSVASGVLDMLRFMADGKPVQLRLDIPEAFPPVLADENRLVQILFNLTHNAMKFTEAGTIVISASVKDNMAYIHVSDTGIGMDEETQRQIFQAYVQGNSGMTAVGGGGLGLGLSICRQLVEMHGGTISVSSTPGHGSTFTFSLPVSNSSAAEVAAAIEEIRPIASVKRGEEGAGEPSAVSVPVNKSPLANRPKILAVDDDPVNLTVIDSILRAEGYEIVTVTNGREALALLQADRWNLLITDVMMPHMSGYELSQLVRERFSISELPVLLLTSRSNPEDIAAGFLSGGNDYVNKPVDPLELKSRVRSLIDLKQSVEERLRMEAAWLQAQINPHFFFNTLNTIAILSEMDTQKMRELLQQFSSYLQRSFDFQNADEIIPIEQELDLVRSYLAIEQARFGDKLRIVWDVAEIHFYLPPLTIQPLVENALVHGLLNQIGAGTLNIHIAGQADYVEVQVIDDGAGMEEEKAKGLLNQDTRNRPGVGLFNTNHRLKQRYGRGLEIRSFPGRGTTVSFRVPTRRGV